MFKARYPGTCRGCGESFAAGTPIKYVQDYAGGAGDGVPVAQCCFEDPEIVIDGPEHRSRTTTTLPRGKTAADRCGVCFQIPASNGVCGCS